MQEPIHIVSGGLAVLALVAVFTIVLVVAYRVLKEMSFFGRTGNWVVACCVALLSVVGCVRSFGGSEPSTGSSGRPTGTNAPFDFILLPYVALPIAIISVLLLSFVLKLLGRGDIMRFDEKAFRKRHRLLDLKERSRDSGHTQDLQKLRQDDEQTKHLKECVSGKLRRRLRS